MAGGALAIAAAAALAACASTAPGAGNAALSPLPLSAQGPRLALRAEARPLMPGSTNLVVHLIVSAPIADARVSVTTSDPGLSVTPPDCDFRVLAPPAVAHAARPPYPLPAIPLCSLVLGASAGGRFLVTLRVRDATGHDLVAPIHTVIVIKGSRA